MDTMEYFTFEGEFICVYLKCSRCYYRGFSLKFAEVGLELMNVSSWLAQVYDNMEKLADEQRKRCPATNESLTSPHTPLKQHTPLKPGGV